jgi:Rieske 2Fe-2S family protein
VSSVIDHGAYFTTLPREYYVSPEIFERELERVFAYQWHYAGHVSEIPAAGDYFMVEFVGERVVVTRGPDGSVHAFLNVCRHRGHPVCQAERGNVKRFICPYHQWSYGLDGRLLNAPSIEDGDEIRYSDWGLRGVQVDVWHGLIFICLSPSERPPVSAALDAVASEMLRVEPERVKKVFELSYEIEANWKVLLENFQECYHCTRNHPELCVAMDLAETYALTGDDGRLQEVYGGGSPPKPGMKTISIDGEPKAPLLGEFGRGFPVPDGFHAGFGIHPLLSRALFNADHGTIHTMRPIDASHVRWISRWFVHEDAVEGRDYDLDTLTEVWRATNDQDLGLVTEAFQGVRSREFVPGPLSSSREPMLKASLGMYLKLMDEG